MPTLLSNASATGDEVTSTGGHFIFRAEASNWNGATLQLQIRGPNDTYIDVEDGFVTANGAFRVYLPHGVGMRAEITGGPPTGVYADIATIDI